MRDFLLFLPVTAFYLVIGSTLLVDFPLPDLPLMVVLYLAYSRASVGGAFLGFALGYVEDVFNGAPLGATSFALVFVFALVHLLSKKVHFSTAAIKIMAAVTMVLLKGFLMYTVTGFLRMDAPFPDSVIITAVVTGFFMPPAVALFEWLTVLTAPRVSRGNIQ